MVGAEGGKELKNYETREVRRVASRLKQRTTAFMSQETRIKIFWRFRGFFSLCNFFICVIYFFFL
jgi:hypothetical protein